MAAQTQTAPGANRRGLNDIALSSVRGFYHGVAPPTVAPAVRDPVTVAGELRAAAQHLCELADDLAAGAFDDCALRGADALLVGCGRLVVELRQRGQVSP